VKTNRLTLSNALTVSRIPIAFLFLSPSVNLRILAIVLAMVTDSIDGFLARRSNSASHFGAILDPVADKFFVFFAISVFLFESKIEVWEACALISRDFSLIFFALYLGLSGHWSAYQCKAIRWGKVSTALQFIILMGLTLNYPCPTYVYGVMVVFGALAFIELYQFNKECKQKTN
jgi:CDP-diacylglycerol--glycerol-3-phosphate 3-phosphatidyltransferase